MKTLVLIYKVIHGQSLSYLEKLIVPYRPTRTLRSQDEGLLVISKISKLEREAELSIQTIQTIQGYVWRVRCALMDQVHNLITHSWFL